MHHLWQSNTKKNGFFLNINIIVFLFRLANIMSLGGSGLVGE